MVSHFMLHCQRPPSLNPGIFKYFMVQSQAGEGGFGTAQLQWLAGLLRWSRAGSRSTTARKQTARKNRGVSEKPFFSFTETTRCPHALKNADGLIGATCYVNESRKSFQPFRLRHFQKDKENKAQVISNKKKKKQAFCI